MKKGFTAVITMLSMVVQCIIALPVTVGAANSVYNLGVISQKNLDVQGAATSTKSLTVAKVEDKIYAYVGKEGNDGGIYIYDVTVPDNIEFIGYCRTVGDASIGGTPQNERFDIINDGTGSYLVFIGTNGMSNNANGAYAAKIKSDGTLGICVKLGDTTHWDSYIKVVDNYVVYNSEKEIFIFRLDNGEFKGCGKMTITHQEQSIMKFAARVVGTEMYIITGQPGTPYTSELHKAELSDSMTFTKHSEIAIDNATYLLYGAEFISDTHAIIGYDNEPQGVGGVYLIEIKDNSLSAELVDVSNGRVWALKVLEDNYYVVSCVGGNIKLFCMKENISSARIDDHSIACDAVDSKIYLASTGMSKNMINIFSYKTGLKITSPSSCIEPVYNLRASVDGLLDSDTVMLSVNNEQQDITEYAKGGNISYDINVEDGSYDIVLSIIRNGESVVSDSVKAEANLVNPIKIFDIAKSNTEGELAISCKAENLYSSKLENGIVFAALYNNNEMLSYDYSDISGLEAGQVKNPVELSLTGYADGMTLKLFALSGIEKGKLISDITTVEGASDSFKLSIDNIARTTDKINVVPYIDPMTNKFRISMINTEEKKADALAIIFEGLSAGYNDIHFIYAGETDEKGSLGFEYLITNPPKEGSEYFIHTSVGKYANWQSAENIKGYYGINTVNSLLDAIYKASGDTVYGVLTKEPYNKLLMLDFEGTYSELDEEPYQKQVLSEIAGKLFDSPATVINTFNRAVSVQLEKQTEDRLDKDLLDKINAASNASIENLIENNYERAGLKLDGLYDELEPEQKTALLCDTLVDKGFTSLELVKTSFEDALKIKVVTEFEYAQIIEDAIIEDHYTELGLSETDVNYYIGYSDKAEILKIFLKEPITDASKTGEYFALAVSEIENDDDEEDKGSSSSGSGSTGGGRYTPSVNTPILPSQIDTTQKPADPDDEIIFDDVSKNAWYYEAVYTLAQQGYVEGVTEKTFLPDKEVTREEFTKMVVLAFGYYNQTAETSFTDTMKYKWHYRYIASAQAAGIINGIGDKLFGVGESITRQDMAVILHRIAENKGISLPETKSGEFKDKGQISTYSKNSVEAMYGAGIITGFPDNTFRPKETATRAMAAKVIWEILNI